LLLLLLLLLLDQPLSLSAPRLYLLNFAFQTLLFVLQKFILRSQLRNLGLH
jgi:hypothetical protein